MYDFFHSQIPGNMPFFCQLIFIKFILIKFIRINLLHTFIIDLFLFSSNYILWCKIKCLVVLEVYNVYLKVFKNFIN